MKIPRKLSVKPNRDEPGYYEVYVGEHRVGRVQKAEKATKDGANLFTWQPDATAFEKHAVECPPPFATRTMISLREELTRRIPRDDYMKILEAPT